jgi:hypothetical protein
MLLRTLLLFLLLTLASVSGLYVTQLRKSKELTARLAATQALTESRRKEVERLRYVGPPSAVKQNESDVLPAVKIELPQSRSRSPGKLDYEKLRNDPRYAPILRKTRLREVERRYGAGIKKMGLSPDIEHKVRELLVAKIESSTDARILAEEQQWDKRGIEAAVARSSAGIEAEIESLIGAEGISALETSDRLSAAHMLVEREIGTDLAAAGVPLSPSQETAVAEMILSPDRFNVSLDDTDPKTGLPRGWAPFMSRLQAVLTPDQLRHAQESLISRVEEIKYHRSIRQEQ